MRCHYHAEEEAIGACATCGHPLCESCTTERDRVFYCESCLAEKEDAAAGKTGAETIPKIELPGGGSEYYRPPQPDDRQPGARPRSKSPGTAALLSIFLPSAGQIYNNQFAKALTFLLLIISCAILADQTHPMEGLFGVIAAFIYFYQIYDAYKTARGFRDTYQSTALVPMLTGNGDGGQAFGTDAKPAGGADAAEESPIWGISLIVLGCVFLLQNFNLIAFNTLLRLWPLFVVVTGLVMIVSFIRRGTA